MGGVAAAGLLAFWVLGALCVGLLASERGRSGVLWGASSLLLSPLVTGILLVAAPQVGQRRTACPWCHEQKVAKALACGHCGRLVSDSQSGG